MLKKYIKLIFIIPILFINNTLASTIHPSFYDSYNLTIQLGNLSLTGHTNLPKHDFFYEMKIPSSEISKGAPLTGSLSYDSCDISTVFYRFDDDNIEVNLNISDPAMGKRIIWKGKIIYNRIFNKINLASEIVDNLHYIIYINTIQPDQGRPQFIIGIVSL